MYAGVKSWMEGELASIIFSWLSIVVYFCPWWLIQTRQWCCNTVPSTVTKGPSLTHEKLPQSKSTKNMGSVSTHFWPHSNPVVCCSQLTPLLPLYPQNKRVERTNALTLSIALSHFSPPWIIVSFSMQEPLQTFVTVILFLTLLRPPSLSHSCSFSNWIHRSEFQWAGEEEGAAGWCQRSKFRWRPLARE